jgi:hypothetical protein
VVTEWKLCWPQTNGHGRDGKPESEPLTVYGVETAKYTLDVVFSGH